MSRLSEVLEASLLRIEGEHSSGAKWRALELAKDVYGAFDYDTPLSEMVRESVHPDSLPLCAEPDEPETVDLTPALEASLRAAKRRADYAAIRSAHDEMRYRWSGPVAGRGRS